MLVREFGLFWRRDMVDWNPGGGKGNKFRLLGRRGQNRPTLQVADFRRQQGVYILYGDHGAYYVGMAIGDKGRLGSRLRSHTRDEHKDKWDKFSWIGFRDVLKDRDDDGLRKLADPPQE